MSPDELRFDERGLIPAVVQEVDTGEVVHTGTAWLTMIALNDRGKPVPVEPVYPESDEDTKLHEVAKARYEARRRERAGL